MCSFPINFRIKKSCFSKSIINASSNTRIRTSSSHERTPFSNLMSSINLRVFKYHIQTQALQFRDQNNNNIETFIFNISFSLLSNQSSSARRYVPAYDASVRNRGRSFARMASSSRWSSSSIFVLPGARMPLVLKMPRRMSTSLTRRRPRIWIKLVRGRS